MSSSSKTNRLAHEKSPYLLQHAQNPVDWYPWSKEAFEEAKKKDKMIFLSVGYSTCHWCHVMEKESFENESIAEVMNDLFVNIKVDREERPDVDQVYMSFVTATSGSGGWPMSVFLTPDLKPVFGGTYFPPEDMPWIRRPGFKTVLKSIHSQWLNDRPRVTEAGETITKLLEKQTEKSATCSRNIPSSEATLMKCFNILNHSWDPQYGGFSRAPKFPQPVNLNFLFSIINDGNDYVERALQMIRKTLDSMAEGGIWDHISKGFARYSTDAEWHVPHFEKMLYDQGQLLVAYSQGYFITKEPKYKRIVEDIIEYTQRDLQHNLSKGFYSGEDADSQISFDSNEKREGAFCTWTYEEIKSILSKENPELFNAFLEAYDFKEDGNASSEILAGQNVLRLKRNAKINRELISEATSILYQYRREKRPMPHLDDKIIAAWNGLMISGLCYAGISLNKAEYVNEAIKTGEFILKHLLVEDEDGVNLMRTVYRNADNHDEVIQTEHPISGFIEDYAFIIRAFLDLYDVTLDGKWLNYSKELQKSQDKYFWDETDGGYFSSRSNDPSIIVRMKNSSDGAEPCGNSVSVCNLVRLSGHFSELNTFEKATKTLEYFSEMLNKHPAVAPEMSRGVLFYHKHRNLEMPEISIRKELLLSVLQIVPLGSPVILKEVSSDKNTFCIKGACQDLGDNEGEVLKKLEEYFCS